MRSYTMFNVGLNMVIEISHGLGVAWGGFKVNVFAFMQSFWSY